MRRAGISVPRPTDGGARAKGAEGLTREQSLTSARTERPGKRGREAHRCEGEGAPAAPQEPGRTKQGLAALTCRRPRAPLGSSTCVPGPGAAEADPGSCPAAPSPLLPGSEAAAPSGKLPASSRRRSSLPALRPAPPRPPPPSLFPAGGARGRGRLRHLREAPGLVAPWC